MNDENFKPFLKKKKHVLVMFYAPCKFLLSNTIIFFTKILTIYLNTGCGHCKKAKPEFTTAAEHYKDDPHVELAAVDCTKGSALCGVFSVKGFPTLKYFNFLKTVKEYNGGRTVIMFNLSFYPLMFEGVLVYDFLGKRFHKISGQS